MLENSNKNNIHNNDIGYKNYIRELEQSIKEREININMLNKSIRQN